MGRVHCYLPVSNISGDLYPTVQVMVINNLNGLPITQNLYSDPVSESVLPNPFALSPSVIDFYAQDAERVILEISIGDLVFRIEDVDLRPPADEMARTLSPMRVSVDPDGVVGGILTGTSANESSFVVQSIQPAHHHDASFTGSTALGQFGTEVDAAPYQTWIGDSSGDDGAHQQYATSMGSFADPYGGFATTLGSHALAQSVSGTFADLSVSVGSFAGAGEKGVSVGAASAASSVRSTLLGHGVSTGSEGIRSVVVGTGRSTVADGVQIGPGVSPSTGGVVVGDAMTSPSPGNLTVGSASSSVESANLTASSVMLGTDLLNLLGFYGASLIAQPEISERSGPAALNSLIDALDALNLVRVYANDSPHVSGNKVTP